MKSKLSDSPLPQAHSLHYVNPEDWNNEETGISWSNLSPREYAGYVGVITPDYLSFGDYDNSSMVERSNLKAFKEEFASRYHQTGRVAKDVYGGHGSESIAIVARRPDAEGELWDEMMEWLSDLDTYPVKDEQLMSQMEMEAFDEAWKDWGEKDFVREITKAINAAYTFDVDGEEFTADTDDVVKAIDDLYESVYELWRKVNEHGNGEEYIIESGGGVHINLDQALRIIKTHKNGYLDLIADTTAEVIRQTVFNERQQKEIGKLARVMGLTPEQTKRAQDERVTSVSGLKRLQGNQ